MNILELFNQLTLEVILTTGFGVDANIQMGENTEMIQKAKGLLRIPQIIRLLPRLPFGNSLLGLLQSVKGNQSYFLKIAKQIIKSRRQQGPTGRKDLLQLMMNANDETTEEQASRLTDDEIVAQCVIFLLAGFETSSNTLGLTLYYLAVNPDVQDKLRLEIKDAIECNVKKPLYEVAQHIEYLDCVVKESQRLCPTLAQVNRECSDDYDLNGVHIPAGTEILIPIYFLHHDPDAWTDPEKFDPERFRSPSKDGRHALQFLPLGAGPRNCIGMRFALMEVKIALVKILTKFRFEKSPETQIPLAIQPGFTLSAKDGVYVRVSKVCV